MSDEEELPPPELDFDEFIEWYKDNKLKEGETLAKKGMTGGEIEFAKRFIKLLDSDPELKKLLIKPNPRTNTHHDIVQYLRDENKKKKDDEMRNS